MRFTPLYSYDTRNHNRNEMLRLMNITYQIRRDFYCVHLFFIFTRDWYSVPISPAISMALQDFSFYFLISNLVAVVLSFSEGGSKHN